MTGTEEVEIITLNDRNKEQVENKSDSRSNIMKGMRRDGGRGGGHNTTKQVQLTEICEEGGGCTDREGGREIPSKCN